MTHHCPIQIQTFGRHGEVAVAAVQIDTANRTILSHIGLLVSIEIFIEIRFLREDDHHEFPKKFPAIDKGKRFENPIMAFFEKQNDPAHPCGRCHRQDKEVFAGVDLIVRPQGRCDVAQPMPGGLRPRRIQIGPFDG